MGKEPAREEGKKGRRGSMRRESKQKRKKCLGRGEIEKGLETPGERKISGRQEREQE